MYLMFSRITASNIIPNSDFGIIKESLMRKLLKNTSTYSVKEFVRKFNYASRNKKLEDQIIITIWEIKLFPPKISKITAG